MTETQRRIRAYKRALPHMKERVIAVALLLAMSVSMMSSATFAWLTLSRSPEVSGLATTIATNGNLEIALSDKDGLEPDETAVGDGGQDVKLSNVTWGNLINLSDSSYGLEDITLRPATLNTGSLDESPLYAVTYGADGRMEDIATDFAFTSYQTSTIEGGKGQFVVPAGGAHSYGVRAVSSVKATTAGAQSDLLALSNLVTKGQARSVMAFQDLYENKSYIDPITKLAGVYISYRISDNDEDCTEYIKPIYGMMQEFASLLDQVGNTVLAIVNLQHFLYCDKVNSDNDPSNNLTFTQFNLTDLHTGTATDVQKKSGQGYIVDSSRKITLTGNTVRDRLIADGFVDQNNDSTIMMLKMYVNMRQKFGPTYEAIEAFNTRVTSNGKVGWEELRGYINVMADIYTATIAGIQAQSVSSGNIDQLTGSGVKEAVVQSGLLVDMDQLLGTNLLVPDVSATVKVYGIPASVKANVTTKAQNNPPYQLIEAATLATDRASGGPNSVTWAATDTYGMAVDFWVRTNAPASLLTLEGKMVTRSVTVGQDENGKDITQTVVVGYEGANRIWEEDDVGLPVLGTSVTQGSGSCYIFYPETPEDQEQSLKLLQAMSVAFISAEGELLAQADMDTSNVFKDGGRVVVPMKLRARNVETGEYTEKMDFNGNIIYQKNEDGTFKLDEDGNKIPEMEPVVESVYYITEMEQNVAKRITAVIYMDGSRLTNSEVLAANAIKGQLNIQFSTTENIISMDENDLKADFYNILITAQANYDQDKYYFDANNKPTVDLTLGVTGIVPKMIKANFVAVVSDTQGAKQPTFSFTKGESGWTAHVTLDGAGEYQLRSLQVDGVDYPLTAEQIESLTFNVKGTSVDVVTCENWNSNSKTHQTADSYYALPMTVELSGTTAKTVQAVYVHDDGQNVAVNFTMQEGVWNGTANFTTSGTYTLTYMIIDGVYVPLAPEQYKTLELKLGLNVQVFVTAPVDSAYKTLETLHAAVGQLPVSETATAATTLTADQITQINGIIDNTTWEDEDGNTRPTEEEKSELKKAISLGTFANEDQKDLMLDTMEAHMEDYLEVLYSEDEGGLALKTTSAGHELRYRGGEPLYMDVSCVITDDKGNIMSDFADVDLFYGIGSSALNQMTAMNMSWNGSRYTGEMILIRPGLYNFQKLSVNNDSQTITRASSAPYIRAISPDPIGYAGKFISEVNELGSYTSYYENITKNADRWISVGLVDASTAEVVLTLAHWNYRSDYAADAMPAKYADFQKVASTLDLDTYTVNASVIGYDENEDGTTNYYFGVNLKDGVKGYNAAGEEVTIGGDGVWRIIGMDIKNVFYKEGSAQGVYYDGVDTENGGTGWMTQFNDDVYESNITTEFFTTVNFTVNKQPDSSYNGVFMQDNIVDNMTITLTDYLGRALDDVQVELQYTWADKQLFTASSSNLPNTSFGGELTPSNGGTDFVIGNLVHDENGNVVVDSNGKNIYRMNFQLAGQYNPTFKITINGKTYTNMDNFTLPGNSGFGGNPVEVKWTAPTMRITAVTPKEGTEFTTLNAAGTSALKLTVQNVFTDYYATIYPGHSGSAYTDWTLPTVSVQLENAGNNYASATASGIRDAGTDKETAGSTTFVFTNNEANATIGSADSYSWDDAIADVHVAGKQTFGAVNLKTADGITFTFKLDTPVVINNPMFPPYVTFASSSADGIALQSTPSVLAATANEKGEFEVTLPEIAQWSATNTDSKDESSTRPNPEKATRTTTISKSAKGICNGKDGYYNYTRNIMEYTNTVIETETASTNNLTGWTISGGTKLPGEKVTISQSLTATPVITATSAVTQYRVVYSIVEYYDDYLDGEDSTSAKGEVVSTVYENGWTKIGDPVQVSRTKID